MEKKKPIILSVIALLALVALVVGATFAYFQAQVGEGKSADVVVKSYTVDTFTFSTGSQISLNLDQDNFASGKGNITGSTYASATLTANNKTNTATEHYYLYLNIENNTFTYSINENTPEIIMTITDSTGTEVTDITGLTHTSVTDAKGSTISGYDITDKFGLITLFNNREITTTSSKEEKWNITITFVNYDASQNANAGKNMSAKVMIQKSKLLENVSEICSSGENLATCITALANKSVSSATDIYHHDANLTNGAGDNSYRYSGTSENVNNFVCFGSDATPCPTDNLYRMIGVFEDKVKLIKYDYATSALLGTDGGYSKDANSSEIQKGFYNGTMDMSTVGVYYWNNSTKKNTWSESNLNKVNLNINFINNIGEEWANKIATTTWKVGGNIYANVGKTIPATAYQNEINNPIPGSYSTTGEIEYSAKIGLMYVSDYGFAIEPSAWTKTLYDRGGNEYINGLTLRALNWMFMGVDEWTISRNSDGDYNAFGVWSAGSLSNRTVDYDNYAVRPSFYLEPSITYVSGSGSASDPIVIN